jgi:hypothetical protein
MVEMLDYWFGGGEVSEKISRIDSYILGAGLYGSVYNGIALKQKRLGNKGKYFLYRVFPPYSLMKFYYPVLIKCKLLLPVFYVIRWFKLVFGGRFIRSVKELKRNNSITQDEAQKASLMLKDLGFSK